jgi:threonine aldolase
LAEPLRRFLKQRGILVGTGHIIRLVTHLDVDEGDIQRVTGAVKQFMAQGHTARPAAA